MCTCSAEEILPNEYVKRHLEALIKAIRHELESIDSLGVLHYQSTLRMEIMRAHAQYYLDLKNRIEGALNQDTYIKTEAERDRLNAEYRKEQS